MFDVNVLFDVKTLCLCYNVVLHVISRSLYTPNGPNGPTNGPTTHVSSSALGQEGNR